MARQFWDPYNKRFENCTGETVTVYVDDDVARTRYTSCLVDMAAQGFELIHQSGRVGYALLKFKNCYGY